MTATAATVVYELWDTKTGNLIADYTEEIAALRDVREGVREDGPDMWATVALAGVAPDGTRVPIAQGGDLLAHAEAKAGTALTIEGMTLDASRLARINAAVEVFDKLANPEFAVALRDLQLTIAAAASETATDYDAARAAVAVLSALSGSPVRLDAEGGIVTLVTPDETMAGLLAAGTSHDPARRNVRVRAVEGGYYVQIAAA